MASSPPVPEDGRAEDFLALGVDENLHEALGLAFFDRSADLGHGALTDQRWLAGLANVGFGHADAAEGRIDVEGVGAGFGR